MSKQSLIDLRDKVKAGEAPEYGSFREAYVETCWRAFDIVHRGAAFSAYNGSLDAAKALHEAVLPLCDVDVEIRHASRLSDVWVFSPIDDGGHWIGTHEITARAWLLAILDALIAKEDGE